MPLEFSNIAGSPAVTQPGFPIVGVGIPVAVTTLVSIVFLSAGFAKLMAMWVNWICAQKVPKGFIAADKGLNLCFVIAYPAILLLRFGASSTGDGFFDSPGKIGLFWWLAIFLGVIGLVALLASTIRYWSYRPPACELSSQSHIFDVRDETGWRSRYLGKKGRLRRIASLPGNEQFTVDVSTKTYELSSLPPCWNGLSIVHLSDIHFTGAVARPYFEVVCDQASKLRPDLFIFSGDLLDHQPLQDWIPDTLGRLQAPLGQFFVLGNHDWYLDAAATRRLMSQAGWTDLSRDTAKLASPTDPRSAGVVICGDETPWMGSHPDLSGIPEDSFRILVSHTPDNITWARRNQIHLMLSGHTHGGQIRLPILGPVYSPSNFGCRYSSGVFWLNPTLMYVSRGISGREPVRYNCRPEVTKLVLKLTRS